MGARVTPQRIACQKPEPGAVLIMGRSPGSKEKQGRKVLQNAVTAYP